MAQIPLENKRPKGGETDGVDRISELPEHVAHHILSFLPTKDVFRTCCLSKLWKTTSSTLPILSFDQTFFHDEGTRNKRGELVNFVEQTLQRRLSQGITISKLELDIPSTVDTILVDRWIAYAVKSNVKNLSLHINSLYTSNPYSFPANSVTMLEKLHLSHTYMGDEWFENLIRCSKDLEELSIYLCSGLKRVKITSLLKLKKLSLVMLKLESLEIEALMNLESIVFSGDQSPCQINIRACQNLASLSLHNTPITDKCFHDLLFNLPLLNLLCLGFCNMLEKIKISSHTLKGMSITWLENLAELVIDTPNLLDFSYVGDVIPFSCNVPSIFKAEIFLESRVKGDSWFSREIEFLGKFNHCKIVELCSISMSFPHVLIPKELREALVPPLYNVKHLSLKTDWEFNSHVDDATVELVDGLLWICPHLETLTIQFHLTKKSIKFLYEEVVDNEENLCPCCKSLPVGCWRHSLKKVLVKNTLSISNSEIKHFRGFGDETNLKKFFLENAEILERMDDLTDCELKS